MGCCSNASADQARAMQGMEKGAKIVGSDTTK